MTSSKINHESGIVTITTPGRACAVGDRLYVQGSAATYGIAHADWVLRLLDPLQLWSGRLDAPDHDEAQARLVEQLRSGEIHESLIERPAQAA